MKIAIDIGHANGTGARGNGLEEHAMCKVIGSFLQDELTVVGYVVDVLDFPEETNSGDLNKTIKAANKGGYDFGISLHCDASDNAEAKGGHVCYHPNSTKGGVLARAIGRFLATVLPGRANTTMAREDLAILKRTKAVWVLVECGFITNKEDAGVISCEPNRIAKAILFGVEKYLSWT